MLLVLLAVLPQDTLTVKADDTVVDRSCTVVVAVDPLADDEGDGVVHVVGDGITVDFAGQRLLGAPPDTPPDALTGVGVWIRGRNVTLRNARVAGFKVAIRATGADGLVIEDCDVSGNFRQRLGSTPAREDAADWLWPHENDGGEWLARYGAGIAVAGSRDVTVRRCRARDVQNGLILDRVTESSVYDNDFSFLSGWGLAMWRSSRNLVSRNALDFCVRGYSHGVYNRGQDSAGILLFEQCSQNVFAENSATHGGDGFFAFAGREALGEAPPPAPDFDHTRRGNNDNLIVGNDFSYAAAHGLELTFSFGNRILENNLVGNAICGIWGGYSRDTLIAGNEIHKNGAMGYGLERGGVNIEHGQRNRIVHNEIVRNACGVHLWWDADEHLASLPWSRANGHESRDNVVAHNRLSVNGIDVQLRAAGLTHLDQLEWSGAERLRLVDDVGSPMTRTPLDPVDWRLREHRARGKTRPVGARRHLAGRERIVMTAWGPYDWEGPLLWRAADEGARHVYRLFGVDAVQAPAEPAGAQLTLEGDQLAIDAREAGVTPYEVEVLADGEPLRARGVLVSADWRIASFPWTHDPREDAEAWRAEGDGTEVFHSPTLDLPFGTRGPSDLAGVRGSIRTAALPPDRFGTIATAELRFPAGRWTLSTTSDDGVRLRADGRLLIDEWTVHAPTRHSAVLDLPEERTVRLEIEHFELDGHAVLRLEIDRAE